MNRAEQRKGIVIEALRELANGKLQIDPGANLQSWPPELQELVKQSSKEPQERMRQSMRTICETLHLRWSNVSPADHPYQAELDGQIFKGDVRLAVVELVAKNNKQIRGDLLDLLMYPAVNKILVVGSAAACEPAKATTHARKVLDLLSPLVGENRAAVFTENELSQDPSILGKFLEPL